MRRNNWSDDHTLLFLLILACMFLFLVLMLPEPEFPLYNIKVYRNNTLFMEIINKREHDFYTEGNCIHFSHNVFCGDVILVEEKKND